MSYLLLITEPGENRRHRSAQDGTLAYEKMLRFGEGLKARGLLIASEALKSDKEGVRVQVRAGRPSMIDGPFSESKEIVGGFFLIDCQTREQALAVAAECPAAAWATIEVRETGPCYGD